MSWRWQKVGKVLAVSAAVGGTLALAGSQFRTRSNLNHDVVLCEERSPSLPSSSHFQERLSKSIRSSIDHCENVQRQLGLPGLAVGVAVNGQVVFEKGFGFADIENEVPMTSNSVIRIASISKPITMTMLAKQMEEGKVDIDVPIQTYLPDFPKKKWEGKEVTITPRHLLSHLSGIRHYRKKEDIDKKKDDECDLTDSDYNEFFMKTGCESVAKALELFKDDELLKEPGTNYSYTTHGWSVVSAIVEKVADTSFNKHAKRMFNYWGLHHTHLDEHSPIIPNRVKHYRRDKHGKLINAPWVDNSCKWAGGGFLSSAQDLIRFAHIMMYCAKPPINARDAPFLKKETIQKLWTCDERTRQPFVNNLYGLGWVVGEPFSHCLGCGSRDAKRVSHSGGAVGATSILLIQFPPLSSNCTKETEGKVATTMTGLNGLVVIMLTNLQDAGLSSTASKIAEEFSWMIT